MKRILLTAAAAAATLMLTGCAGLTGLIDAGDEFGCGVTPGVRCATLSQNHDAAENRIRIRETTELIAADSLPKAPATEKPAADPAATKTPAKAKRARKTDASLARVAKTNRTREPARSSEEVMMLWVMPWVDAEGDFHSVSRVWVKVKEARWQIERERTRATEISGWETP